MAEELGDDGSSSVCVCIITHGSLTQLIKTKTPLATLKNVNNVY